MDLVGQAENDGILVIPKTKQGKVSYLSPVASVGRNCASYTWDLKLTEASCGTEG